MTLAQRGGDEGVPLTVVPLTLRVDDSEAMSGPTELITSKCGSAAATDAGAEGAAAEIAQVGRFDQDGGGVGRGPLSTLSQHARTPNEPRDRAHSLHQCRTAI